jgi:2-oxoglutarate ferredoxin oxidoreductase subunit gamma
MLQVTELIFAGFGGQGILAAGIIMANAGMKDNKNVSWMPSYGAEMRGGTANCAVKINEGKIASPYVDNPDILIAMNEPSLEKFKRAVKPGGLIIVNSSLVNSLCERDDVEFVQVPVLDAANELGNGRAANIVMLGALIEKKPLVSKQSMLDAIREYFATKGEEVYRLNEKALAKGAELIAG